MTATAFAKILSAAEETGRTITKRTGNGFRMSCPAHDGSNPSMSVFDTETRVNLKCHSHDCDAADILEALGLSIRDRYDADQVDYRYDDGRVAHRGTQQKRFWQSGNKDGMPSLYRRDKIAQAVADGVPVLLVEGEEDVHAAEAIGAVATTAPQGAANFTKVDATPLTGASVVAVVDRDEAGDKWAAAVRAKLDGLAAVRFVHAKIGKDLSDHITAGCTLSELEDCSGVADVTADSGGGAELLTDVERFLGRFVAYPSEHARIAHTLWIAHTWFMDQWDSTPRIGFLSTEPGSGKSRALEVTEPLVPRPVHAVNTSPAYLFRKVSDPDGAPTILYDEIDTVFGPKAKDNEDVRGMLNAGHRKGAVAGRCVMRGKVVETEELPAYCAVALAGLDDLPDTIGTRTVIIRMRRRAPGERVEPWRHRINGPQAAPIRERLARWSDKSSDQVRWPEMPDGIEDRNADVWEPLLALADLAGDDWPERARTAAVALVRSTTDDGKRSLGIQLLTDMKKVFGQQETMTTDDILNALIELEESPWGDLRGRELDARGLSYRLRKYDVKPGNIRVGDRVVKGYKAVDMWDPWERYLPVGPDSPATSATPLQTPEVRSGVADVADESGDPKASPDPTPAPQPARPCSAPPASCANGNCRVFNTCTKETAA
ncbi:DUF3631 domain-containing protein [Microlunatus sp. Y2014]|uniref:DUF3631 domain-containing protein n=1 Tax=Microlunatus sp. Y2014 TaxID=3418488 RepID=UPI003DA76176